MSDDVLDLLGGVFDETPATGEVFTPEDHVYYLDGDRIPGTTEIPKELNLISFGNAPEEVLARAADKGTTGHAMGASIFLGRYDQGAWDPKFRPYAIGIQNFVRRTQLKARYIEERAFSRRRRFGGTIDFCGEILGRMSILDLKFGADKRAYRLQTGGYKILAEECWGVKIERRYLLLVNGDATEENGKDGYRLLLHDKPEDEAMFLAALSLYNWSKRKKD